MVDQIGGGFVPLEDTVCNFFKAVLSLDNGEHLNLTCFMLQFNQPHQVQMNCSLDPELSGKDQDLY